MSVALLAGSGRTALVATLTYVTAIGAAVLSGSDLGGLNAGVEGVSAGAGAVLGDLGAVLPLGYAFAAGMVAAANPCGFALLPAYLALYLGGHDAGGTHPSGAARLARAARVGLTVSVGFTLLFGVAGLLLGLMATVLVRLFPWVGLAVGVALVALGARLVGGATVYTSFGERLADHLGRRARRASASGYFLYGLAYGAASLSCTLPIFLAVVGGAFTAREYLAASAQFLLYALGMSVVVVGMTVALAAFRDVLATRARRVMPYVHPASAVLLLLAGAYIISYWLTLGGLLSAARHRA